MRNCVDEAENKMLTIMEDKIKQKMQQDSDFRCMVMVSRRLYAACLHVCAKSYENTYYDQLYSSFYKINKV